MRQKVKWIFFWICMVLWFGNMFGCASPGEEQNYKASQPEHPSRFERFDSQRTVPVDEAAPGQTVFVADEAPAPDAPAPAATTDANPSLIGLDRAHWPKIKISAETGTTHHLPIYFTDYHADRAEPTVNFNDPIETQLESALSGTRDHGLCDGHHALQLLSQPSKFGLDIILLPYRMVVDAPWKDVTTP